MTLNELQAMTVMQLRKVAKENHVVLGAGIDKAGIVEKIYEAVGDAGENGAVSSPAEEPAAAQAAAPEAQKEKEAVSSGPKYQAAWHNTTPAAGSPRYKPTQSNAFGPRSGGSGAPAGASFSRPVQPEQRIQPLRPGTNTPRFGPANASPAPVAPNPATVEGSAHAQENVSRPAPRFSPLPERRFGGGGGDNTIGPRSIATYSANYVPEPEISTPAPESAASAPVPADPGSNAPSLEELLSSGDYEEGSGVLELHPDGYGFLRAAHFLPSSRDVYVSQAQIRRFGLRTGDMITGKIRPQREEDKYAALLYISTINGQPAEEVAGRPLFDELTPTYPTRRISLEAADGRSWPDMRLVDLIAPIGFGQRALILAPPNTGKTELMQHMAEVITRNYENVKILMLLIDVNPEDVTLMREQVPCPVLASTFDQPPESHLRLSEMVLERAMRLVEQKEDVVLLVDSLTRLAKVYTTAAVQQGRSLPGMVNPASLFRAKKLFGSARCCKEGGSLTVIAAMDILTGSKVDDTVVEEFRGTANMELTLDPVVARAGVKPAINLLHSFTKNSDQLLDARQKEGLQLIRTMLSNATSAVAIPQLLSMMEKAKTNRELLMKMKDWFALMNR